MLNATGQPHGEHARSQSWRLTPPRATLRASRSATSTQGPRGWLSSDAWQSIHIHSNLSQSRRRPATSLGNSYAAAVSARLNASASGITVLPVAILMRAMTVLLEVWGWARYQ